MTPPIARIAHAMPGRLRLRITDRRGDQDYFLGLPEQLRGLPGTEVIRFDPRTASLLVRHRSDPAKIAEYAREHGLFELDVTDLRRTPRSTAPASNPLGTARQKTAPLAMMAVAFGCLSAYQFAQGRVAGHASEALWNAYTAQVSLRKPWLSRLLASFGVYNLARGRVLSSAPALLFYAASAWSLMQRSRDSAGEGSAKGSPR